MTIELFRNEYKVPLLPPELAANLMPPLISVGRCMGK
jgi:hypothetical protein